MELINILNIIKLKILSFKNQLIIPVLIFFNFAIGQNQFSLQDNQIKMYVNVWGEVKNPGRILVESDSDLIKIISLSGGPKPGADFSRVKISRTEPVTKNIIMEIVNLKKILNGQIDSKKIQIYPEDTIYIPEKWTAKLMEKDQIYTVLLLILNLIILIN